MAETKRGIAMLLLTAGDAEISGALADGIMAARLPAAKPLTREEAQVVTSAMKWLNLQAQERKRQDAGETRGQGTEASCAVRGASAEIERQKVVDWQEVAHRMRVTMHREPVDYAGLAFDAEMQYGESLYAPGVLGKIGEKLLVMYALIVLAFDRLFSELGMRNEIGGAGTDRLS